MLKYLINLIFIVSILPIKAISSDVQQPICNSEYEGLSIPKLESLYSKSEVVFLANVEIDYSSALKYLKWKYSIIDPILKGELGRTGYLVQNTERCSIISAIERGVYLVFWESGPEPISNMNAVPVVYGKGQVYEEWILEWVKFKT